MSTITIANSCSHVLRQLIYNTVQHKKSRIMNIHSKMKHARKKKSFTVQPKGTPRWIIYREVLL